MVQDANYHKQGVEKYEKIPWDMEEMVALVDLYHRYENGMISNLSKELYDLSKCLINRADLLMITHDEKYRNVNGINMIFQNIRYVDTNGKTGLSSAWNLLGSRWDPTSCKTA